MRTIGYATAGYALLLQWRIRGGKETVCFWSVYDLSCHHVSGGGQFGISPEGKIAFVASSGGRP